MAKVPCFDAWEYILLENGYQLAFAYGINRYYVDSQKKHLSKTLQESLNFLKQFEIKVVRTVPVRFVQTLFAETEKILGQNFDR